MKQRLLILAVAFLAVTLVGATWLGLTSLAAGQALDDPTADRLRLISEETGLVASDRRLSPDCDYDRGYGVYLCPAPAPAAAPQRGPAAAARAKEVLNSTGLLLSPDSLLDRVMAFDPVTGDLVDPDFIPSHPALGTLINAILSASRDSILVSDQIQDVVHEFDLDGNYLGIFAPAGGPNPAILDNIRGIALRSNGNLLVTVSAGTNANSIAEFDTAGNYLGNFVAIGSGGLDSPFDVYQRPADWLVGSIDSNLIHRYDLTGAFIANLTSIDTFPEQIQTAANSNVLVANFSGTEEGVVEYTAVGALVGIYNPAALGGYRGVYELPNGNILTTTGTGVYEIDRSGAVISTKITGVSGRFIEYLPPSGPDLSLEKSVTPVEAAPGETIEYVVEFLYTDAPTGTATGVVITDLVPIYLTNVGWASSGAVITPTGSLNYVWMVEDLLPGAAGTITITGQIDHGLAGGLVFTNTATITSTLTEPNLENNLDAVTVTVLNAAPVAVDDEWTTPEDQPVTIPVLDNDTDPNDDPLVVIALGTPAHGTATTDGTTVTYTPTLNFAGVDTWTYTIADPGGLTATATVTLNITAVNDPPTISEIPDQVIPQDTSTGPIPFVVGDVETPATDLLLSATVSNASLVPIDQVVFGGSGITRTVTVTPTAGMAGMSTITVTVSDGTDTDSETFLLTVLERPLFRVYLPIVTRAGP